MWNNPYQYNSQSANPQEIMSKINQLNQQGYNYQQMQPQMAQMPQNQPMSNLEWIMVNGIDGAKNVTLQPNSKAWLMDSNEPIFFLKQADGMGVSTIKAYRFNEIDLTQSNPQTNNVPLDVPTRAEFDALKAKIEQYENMFTQSLENKPEETKTSKKESGK